MTQWLTTKKQIGTAPSKSLGKTTTTNVVHSKLSHVSKGLVSGKKDGVEFKLKQAKHSTMQTVT